MQARLRSCILIEETLAEIYRELARAVPCEEELRVLWRRLAREEEENARQLRSARGSTEEWGLGQIRFPPGGLDDLWNRAKGILAGVQSSRVGRDEALCASIRLERDFLEAHPGPCEDLSGASSLPDVCNGIVRSTEDHLRLLLDHLAAHPSRSRPLRKAAPM